MFLAAVSVPEPAGAQEQEELVERLESSSAENPYDTPRFRRIAKTTFTGPQLVRITSNFPREDFDQQGRLLSYLSSSPGALSSLPEASVGHLVEAIESDRFSWYPDVVSAFEVIAESGRLNDAAYRTIAGWLASPEVGERDVAVGTLGALHESDSRIPDALNQLIQYLPTEPHASRQDEALRRIERLTMFVSRTARHEAPILEVALGAGDMRTRLRATDFLLAVGVTPEVAARLSAAFVAELSLPDSESERGDTTRRDEASTRQALELLTRLHDPPYPAGVIDAWIAHCTYSLDWLRAAHQRDELSESQVAALEATGLARLSHRQRPTLYEIVLHRTDPRPDVEFHLYTFEYGHGTERVKAGYRLKYIVEQFGGTDRIHDAARRVLADLQMVRLAGDILIASRATHGNPERYLLAAYRRAEQSHLQNPIASSIIANAESGPEPRSTLLGYAEDERLPFRFRASLLRREAGRAGQGNDLPDDTAARVRRLARSADHLLVRRAAVAVLEAYGRPRPLRAILEDQEYREGAFTTVYVAVVVGTVVLFFVGLAGYSYSAWRLLGWLAFSAWMILAFLVGLVSMLGHGSGPALSQVVAGNILLFLSFPLYAMTAIKPFRADPG